MLLNIQINCYIFAVSQFNYTKLKFYNINKNRNNKKRST